MRRAWLSAVTLAALASAGTSGVAGAPGGTGAGAGAGAAPDPRPVAALRAGDHEALRALSRSLPAADLLAALTGTDVTGAHAAIAMADSAPEAWRTLGRLAELARGWNRGLAAAAAEAARRVALGLTPDTVEREDLGDDELARPQQRWADVVAHGDRWPDVRAAGLTIVAALADARAALPDGDPAPARVDLRYLADPEPVVRRAAIELISPPLEPTQVVPLARALLEDDAAPVALAAAQALCAELAGLDAETDADGVRAVLARLGAPGLARVRELVADEDLAPAAQLDAARCLHASGERDDLAAVRQLSQRQPREVRALIAAWSEPAR